MRTLRLVPISLYMFTTQGRLLATYPLLLRYTFILLEYNLLMKQFNKKQLDDALSLLAYRIHATGNLPLELVVCGGSALIATNLINRTTKDVDILALHSTSGLIDPDPLPDYLVESAEFVANIMNLPDDWLHTGPADLFRMGLPEGLEKRVTIRDYGTHLSVLFISRIDQIHFKLYAAVDRGGYHIDDLMQLNPTDDELIAAAQWSQTHDVSEPYTELLRTLLAQLGYTYAAARI